ncbi:hypothetical protein ROZALSC1DRAFT_23598, partial [Rozella allomycis CSF55]
MSVSNPHDQNQSPRKPPDISETNSRRRNTDVSIVSTISSFAQSPLKSFTWKITLDDKLQEQYLNYQKPFFLKQWRGRGNLGILASVLFAAYAYLVSADMGFKFIYYVISLTMLVLSVAFVMITRTEWYKRNAFPVFSTYMFFLGVALSCLDMNAMSTDPAGYFFCFLALLYTTQTPDHRYLGAMGTLLVLVACILLSLSIINPNRRYDVCQINSNGNCEKSVALTCLYYIVANFIGWVYSFVSLTDSKKQFYKMYSLWEERRMMQEASEKADALALSIIPKGVWDDFRKGEKVDLNGIMSNPTYSYRNVTILFGDIVGFTTLSTTVSAEYLVELLN